MIWGRRYHESKGLSTEVLPLETYKKFYHGIKACRFPKYLKYVWVLRNTCQLKEATETL